MVNMTSDESDEEEEETQRHVSLLNLMDEVRRAIDWNALWMRLHCSCCLMANVAYDEHISLCGACGSQFNDIGVSETVISSQIDANLAQKHCSFGFNTQRAIRIIIDFVRIT
eukprot:183433_1